MYRDHVWISTLRRLLVAQVLVLLCAPALWSQAFGTSVNGSAKACGRKKSYGESNPLRSEGGKGLECKNGAVAIASSQVLLTHNAGNLGRQDGAVAVNNGGSATAMSEASDTMTLVPPSTYDKLTVSLQMDDVFSVTAATGSGSVTFTWVIPKVLKHSQTTDSNGLLILQPELSRSNLTGPFQFQIKKTVEASASTSYEVIYYSTDGIPNFDFPLGRAGWTCTWASGRPCTVQP
jgi:hypothetical protein